MKVATRRLLEEQIAVVVVLESGKKDDAMWHVPHSNQFLNYFLLLIGFSDLSIGTAFDDPATEIQFFMVADVVAAFSLQLVISRIFMPDDSSTNCIDQLMVSIFIAR